MKLLNEFVKKTSKEKIIYVVPYLISTLICSRIIEIYRLCQGNIIAVMKNIRYIYKTFPDFTVTDLLIGIPIGIFIIWYVKFEQRVHKKNTRNGEEYGSARWSA